jgi:hypothetical protein
MIDLYLNQNATWKQVIGNDGYGDPITNDVPIKCRWEANQRLVRDKQGQQVVSVGRVFTNVPVKVGDYLNDGNRDWPVIMVQDMPGLDGKIAYREVSV